MAANKLWRKDKEEDQIFESYKDVPAGRPAGQGYLHGDVGFGSPNQTDSAKSINEMDFGGSKYGATDELIEEFHEVVVKCQKMKNLNWWDAVEFITCIPANNLLDLDPDRCLAAEYVQKRMRDERGSGVDYSTGERGMSRSKKISHQGSGAIDDLED